MVSLTSHNLDHSGHTGSQTGAGVHLFISIMNADGGLKTVVSAAVELALHKFLVLQTGLDLTKAEMRWEQFCLSIICNRITVLGTHASLARVKKAPRTTAAKSTIN